MWTNTSTHTRGQTCVVKHEITHTRGQTYVVKHQHTHTRSNICGQTPAHTHTVKHMWSNTSTHTRGQTYVVKHQHTHARSSMCGQTPAHTRARAQRWRACCLFLGGPCDSGHCPVADIGKCAARVERFEIRVACVPRLRGLARGTRQTGLQPVLPETQRKVCVSVSLSQRERVSVSHPAAGPA